jgi:hypothetical protein
MIVGSTLNLLPTAVVVKLGIGFKIGPSLVVLGNGSSGQMISK